MSIKILTGKPQQFKELSSNIYHEIGEALGQKTDDAGFHANLFLVVPEQYTLTSERALMSALNLPGLIEADVLSLRRLSSRIMTEVGGQTKEIIDDRGRMLILAKVVQELRNHLKLYHRSSYHAGFVKSLSDLLTELKQNCISVDDLTHVYGADSQKSWTGQKLSEMISIFQQYEMELDDQQWDIDRYTIQLCENIKKSQILNHAKIWMDGFFTFSANDFAILEAIAERVDDLTITLSGDLNPLAKDMQIFSVCRNTAEKLAEIATKTGQDFQIKELFQNDRDETPYSFLRDECFSFHPASWPQETDFITLHRYQDPWEEALFIAEAIAKGIREKKWRYQDVAVLCGSLEEKGPLLQRALSDLNIPSFCDLPVRISEDPLIEGFLSAIETVTSRYKESALFSYAKSGYASLPIAQWNTLENYALAKGIRGKKWESVFEDEDEKWDIPQLESYRKKLIEPLADYQKAMKAAQIFREYLFASVNFLDQIHAYDTLISTSERLISEGDFENAGKIRQVWHLLMSIFDQIEGTMGDFTCDPATFLQVIKSGMETCKIGILPNRRDVVQIIEPLRSRGGKIKALFIIGANEGTLPSDEANYPLFSEDDRELLADLGLNLQDDAIYRRSRMDYSIYTQMFRATEMISLSWCLSDSEGNALQPSSLATAFCEVFSHNSIRSSSDHLKKDWILGGARTLDEVIKRRRLPLSSEEGAKNELILNWYQNQSAWKKQTSTGMRAKAYHGIETNNLSENLIHGLYGDNLTLSVSRIEKYNACPFAHFLKYGLKPLPREKFEVNPMDMGSLVHEVIEKCFDRIEQENLSVKTMSEKTCSNLVHEVMDDLLEQDQYKEFSDTASSRFLSKKLCRVTQRTICMIVEHLKKGDFDFQYAEAPFIRHIEAPEFSQKLRLKGKIDRIDLYTKENESYIKIIDYKTGEREIDYSQIYYGVSIQLLCYLQEGVEWLSQQFPEKVFLPAGAFYFHVDDPLVDEIDPEKLEAKVNDAFRMKGLFLDDATVIQAMDLNAEKKSTVFEKGSGSNCLSEDDFAALMDFVSEQINESIRGILEGCISLNPLKTSKYDPCKWCDYRQICQLDQQINHRSVFQIKEKITKDQLLEQALSGYSKGEVIIKKEGGDES